MRLPFQRPPLRIPEILYEAWEALGDPRTIAQIVEVSAMVSTNQVFRLELSDGHSLITKASSYGSYFLFREDHERIRVWHDLLARTDYRDFLSTPLLTRDAEEARVFTYYDGQAWVVFYEEVPARLFMPRQLDDAHIKNFGEEMARLHRTCHRLARDIPPTARSIKSDAIYLLEMLRDRHARRSFGMRATELSLLEDSTFKFLIALEDLHYDSWQRIPLLTDWNIGNFSIDYDDDGRFHLFSRWDYDWFRLEPFGLDFYFCSRVCRAGGDQTVFSYLPDTLLEDRFVMFLRAYHTVMPLTERDLLFLPEAFRFFILNYVVRQGDHFFQPEIVSRLKKETLAEYLPALDRLDFRTLVDAVLG